MKRSLKYLSFCFLFSCAQKVDHNWSSESLNLNSETKDRKQYASCNLFSDKTFRGYIWRSSSSTFRPQCVNIEIVRSPGDFLTNKDLFLQIYPFTVGDDKIDYGKSLTIYTIKKSDSRKDILISSKIIDKHLVEIEMGLNVNSFFSDHFFELCNMDSKWEAIQFVLYERRTFQKEATPVRTTAFLTPPFLIHPEQFKNHKGEALAAFHPFLEHIQEFSSDSNQYYDLSEDICADVL